MGVDIGTTAIAATLFHPRQRRTHAIYWLGDTAPDGSRSTAVNKSYKLPLAAYFSTGQLVNPATPPTALGAAALQPDPGNSSPQSTATGLLLQRFKPYLNITLPFRSPQTQQWEPQIRQSETQCFPLILVQQTLTTLLSALKPDASTPLVGQADDLSPEVFRQAMTHLAGVVINHPVGSSDAYRFNMREAVLATGLVTDPAQIYFLEDAIAALLPDLYHATPAIAPQSAMLVISAGTSTTEVALAQLPDRPQDLGRQHLTLRRLPYAGNALDQDIICRLLFPTAIGWEALGLDQLTLPLPGEPDLRARYQLQQRLESVPLGQTVLKAVRQIKPALCQHDLTFTLDNNHWELRYRDLQSWVLAPYLQQLNREVNLLLNQMDLTPGQVQTVVCTGGTAAIAAVGYWLQHKFPHATIAHSSNTAPTSEPRDRRVTEGLALLPEFPNVLDRLRHQFSDYFLLRTMLKTIPVQAEPLSAAHILNLLTQQGIPVEACQRLIDVLLEGQLPPGLLMSKASAMLLSPESIHTAEYQELAAAPLFSRQGNQIYRLNRPQRDRVWNHLQMILANTQQRLETPCAIGLTQATDPIAPTP